jgi:ketosteroid isomerase-like protein
MIRTDDLPVAEAIVALEHSSIERWNRGDVDGCLEIYADDVSYFDPVTEKRLDGRQAVERYFRAV